MKKEILKYLVCPITKENLLLKDQKEDKTGEIISGKLVSLKSKRIYYIKNYVPNFLEKNSNQKKFQDWEVQWLDKDFEFNKNDTDTGSSKAIFEEDYRLDLFNFKNENILEAGCGSGRITNLIYKNKIKNYFCMDISDAILEAREKHKNKKNIHFIKGDISNPPFKNEFFNKIFLIAVLQHTKNPSESVEALSEILKVEGHFFGGNYLLPENFFVRMRFYFTEIIRFFFRILKIPHQFIKIFTKLSIYSRRYFFLRPLQWLFFNNSISKECSDKFLWLNNHDYYNPNIYQHMYTREQTKNLFLRSSLTPIAETKSVPNAYVFKKNI